MALSIYHLNLQFVIVILCFTDLVADTIKTLNGTAKTVFIHALRKDDFFSIYESRVPVLFKAFLLHRPELPAWMKLAQGSMDDDAFLYGTPPKPQQVTLHIIALNRGNHLISQEFVNINIGPSQLRVTHEVEFRIKNMNVEDFLKDNVPEKTVLKDMQTAWPKGNLQLTKVSSMLHEGGRIPIDDGHKFGVLVRIGNNQDYSDYLKKAESELKNCQEKSHKNVDLSLNRFLRYPLDGCKFRLLPHTRIVESSVNNEPIIMLANAFNPPPEKLPAREYLTDFILIMTIPLAILLLLIILLSCIMFGHREGVVRRNKATPGMQLTQFSSIRRATDNLRNMANEREGPAPLAASQNTYQRRSPSTPPSQYGGSFQASTPRHDDARTPLTRHVDPNN